MKKSPKSSRKPPNYQQNIEINTESHHKPAVPAVAEQKHQKTSTLSTNDTQPYTHAYSTTDSRGAFHHYCRSTTVPTEQPQQQQQPSSPTTSGIKDL